MTVPKFLTFETCVNFIKVPYLTLSKPSHWWARVQLLVLLTSGSSCYRASIFGTVTKNDATRQHQRKLRRNVTVVTERLNFLDFGTLRGGIAPLVSLSTQFKYKARYGYIGYFVYCVRIFEVREYLWQNACHVFFFRNLLDFGCPWSFAFMAPVFLLPV